MSRPIFQINVSLRTKYCVCVCIHEYVCVCVWEEIGSSQQMCSMRWQHDVYFACSIWHVWMLPCILSRCEVMARDAQPPRDHSPRRLRRINIPTSSLLTKGETSSVVSCFVFPTLILSHWGSFERPSEHRQTVPSISLLSQNLTPRRSMQYGFTAAPLKGTSQGPSGWRSHRLSVHSMCEAQSPTRHWTIYTA